MSSTLTLPSPFPQWRFFKAILASGRAVQFRDRFYSAEQLQRRVDQLNPLHLYFSVGYYLNPTTVGFNDFKGKRAGYQNAYNLLINGDLVFDVDAHVRPMSDAKQYTCILKDVLKQKGYDPEIHSSGGGFHAIVNKHDLELTEQKPKERLAEFRKLREPIVKEIQEEHHIPIDREISLDPKRVIRVVGSMHGITGRQCVVVDDLDGFDVGEVDRVSANPVTHREGGDDANFSYNNVSETRLSGRRLPHTEQQTPTSFFALTTHVIPTNRHCLLIRFTIETPLSVMSSKLHTLLAKETLAPFFLFENTDPEHSCYYAISPTALEIEHIPNLLKHFPFDKASYVKFGRRLLPLRENGEIAGIFITQIGEENPKAVVSRTHTEYLEQLLNTRIQGTKCGGNLIPFAVAGQIHKSQVPPTPIVQ